MHRLSLMLLLTLSAACAGGKGDETDGGTTDGGTTDGGTTLSSEEAEVCACLADQTCGAEVCPSVLASCDDCGEETDEANLECALTALRDRTPGAVGWHTDSAPGGLFSRTRVYIRADATAVVERDSEEDLCTSDGPDTLVILKEAAYFDGCLAMTEVKERVSCLTDGLGEETAVCATRVESCNTI